MAQRSDQTTDASTLDRRYFIIIGRSWLDLTKRFSTSCIAVALPGLGFDTRLTVACSLTACNQAQAVYQAFLVLQNATIVHLVA